MWGQRTKAMQGLQPINKTIMTLPNIITGNRPNCKILLDPGGEWVTPLGEIREVIAADGPRIFIKTTKDGKVISRKYYNRAGFHKWITETGARRYTL